jgi:hypothetical protein
LFAISFTSFIVSSTSVFIFLSLFDVPDFGFEFGVLGAELANHHLLCVDGLVGVSQLVLELFDKEVLFVVGHFVSSVFAAFGSFIILAVYS